MRKNSESLRKIATLSILLAAAIILNIIDFLIPLPLGFRLGLANIVGLFVLYVYGIKEALVISVLRVVVAHLLRGFEINTFMMAMAGGLVSMLLMWVMKSLTPFGIVVASTVGAISHSAAQLLVAIPIFASSEVLKMLPFMLLTAIPTGIVIGIIAGRIIHVYVNRIKM